MKQIKLNSKLELHVQFWYSHCKDAEVLASSQRKTSENSQPGWDTEFMMLGQRSPLLRGRRVCELVFIGTLWIWQITHKSAILGEKGTARYYSWKPNKLQFEITCHFLATGLLNIYHYLVRLESFLMALLRHTSVEKFSTSYIQSQTRLQVWYWDMNLKT